MKVLATTFHQKKKRSVTTKRFVILNVLYTVGGLGEWSNQSCKEILCNPGAADLEDQVCCECNAGSSQSRSPRQALSRGTHQIGHFGLLLVRNELEI